MREDVKQKHFCISLRQISMDSCIQACFVERFWFSHLRSPDKFGGDGDAREISRISWFHTAVLDTMVAKLRKPAVGLSANHHPM